MMDILIIEDPSKKNIRNMYLNNYNYFHKNNIKMRHKKKHIINKHIKEKEFDRLTHPMPKMLYSTSSSFNFTAKRIEDKLQQAKPIIDDLINLVDNFSISLSSDNESKKEDFFITNKPEINNNNNIDFINEIERDHNQVKILKSNEITNQSLVDDIKSTNKNFKKNLQLENYSKFKFSRTGIAFPSRPTLYEVPAYQGNDKFEKQYFNYRKGIKYPDLIYNKISSFGEQFNKELRSISHSYGTVRSRTRFSENPLLNKYMEMIPIYDIYKDIKYIENRYVDSKYKFKLLPLLNSKLRNLDKLAERVYKNEQMRQHGLGSLLQIENTQHKNKNKNNKGKHYNYSKTPQHNCKV